MILPSLFAWGLAFHMLVGSLAQVVPDVFPTDIPDEEAETLRELEFIVRMNAVDILRDWESPVYPLIFQVPLPIPPLKEPLMYV